MKLYEPMWFHINKDSICKNDFKTIKSLRYFKEDLKKIVDPVIQQNVKFCNPENFLLEMITNEVNHVREFGCRRILKAKEMEYSTIMQFHIQCRTSEQHTILIFLTDKNVKLQPPTILKSVDFRYAKR